MQCIFSFSLPLLLSFPFFLCFSTASNTSFSMSINVVGLSFVRSKIETRGRSEEEEENGKFGKVTHRTGYVFLVCLCVGCFILLRSNSYTNWASLIDSQTASKVRPILLCPFISLSLCVLYFTLLKSVIKQNSFLSML